MREEIPHLLHAFARAEGGEIFSPPARFPFYVRCAALKDVFKFTTGKSGIKPLRRPDIGLAHGISSGAFGNFAR